MKNHQVLALFVAAVMAFACAPAITADAAGLTQARTPADVKYMKLSKADIAILAGLFDYEFYRDDNPDVVEKLGDSKKALFNHACRRGVFEGRPLNNRFNVSVYASAYPDVAKVAGRNVYAYYQHYLQYGQKEGRAITTLSAAAKAGITVHPINNPEISITPAMIKVAEEKGITDVTEAFIEAAKIVPAASSSTSGSSSGSPGGSSSSASSSSGSSGGSAGNGNSGSGTSTPSQGGGSDTFDSDKVHQDNIAIGNAGGSITITEATSAALSSAIQSMIDSISTLNYQWVITSIKFADNNAQVTNSTTITTGMYKVSLAPSGYTGQPYDRIFNVTVNAGSGSGSSGTYTSVAIESLAPDPLDLKNNPTRSFDFRVLDGPPQFELIPNTATIQWSVAGAGANNVSLTNATTNTVTVTVNEGITNVQFDLHVTVNNSASATLPDIPIITSD